jgi:hypothetical protein
MKSILAKVQVFGLLIALPALAGDVGLHKGSAQPTRAKPGEVKTLHTMGICFPAPNELYSLENVLEPKGDAGFYLRSYENKQVANTDPGTITILQQPTHGILRLVTEADRGTLFSSSSGPIDPANPGYVYLPEKGYLGKDKTVALVEIGGVKVKVVYFFQAINGPLGDVDELCGKKGYHWKISSTLDANGNSPRRLG